MVEIQSQSNERAFDAPAHADRSSAGVGLLAWVLYALFSLALLMVAALALALLVRSVAAAGQSNASIEYVLGLRSRPVVRPPWPVGEYRVIGLFRQSGHWRAWSSYVWPDARNVMEAHNIPAEGRELSAVHWAGQLRLLVEVNFSLLRSAAGLAVAVTFLGMLMQVIFRLLGFRSVAAGQAAAQGLADESQRRVHGLLWRHWLVALLLIAALWLLGMRIESRFLAMHASGMLPGMLGLLAAGVWAVVLIPLLRPRKSH
ncbi:MAG: hypothetical protein HKL96_12410 [Phycisphaerales bacterium]|nr:hypothetical protein [Phycisphaerales bacterium]